MEDKKKSNDFKNLYISWYFTQFFNIYPEKTIQKNTKYVKKNEDNGYLAFKTYMHFVLVVLAPLWKWICFENSVGCSQHFKDLFLKNIFLNNKPLRLAKFLERKYFLKNQEIIFRKT